MYPKRTPKCLVGTVANDLGTPLATSSGVLGLKDTSSVPQETHFDLIWRPIGPHYLPRQAVLTSLRGQFRQLTIMHNSYNGVHCSQFIDRSITSHASPSFIIQSPKSQTSANIHPHRITCAHKHHPVHVISARNTSELTDLHLQFTLTKFDMTIGTFFALHFKNRHREVPDTSSHTSTNTHIHTPKKTHTHKRTHIAPPTSQPP